MNQGVLSQFLVLHYYPKSRKFSKIGYNVGAKFKLCALHQRHTLLFVCLYVHRAASNKQKERKCGTFPFVKVHQPYFYTLTCKNIFIVKARDLTAKQEYLEV